LASHSVRLKSGRTLDQELIDKLGAEAEHGYDLANASRVFLREGRPVRGSETGESPRVASRVPLAVYEAARQRAAKDGITVSEVIRALITGYAAGKSSRVAAGIRHARVTKRSQATGTDRSVRRSQRRTS
jgi:hypothetical protein